MALERLQKILAAAGVASRRKAEELITAGRISVNGNTVTELGSKADQRTDEIRVDGALLHGPERHVYLLLYKPKGYVTTVADPEGRPTVMDLLKDVQARVFPVGRLDYASEGLLLVTNDGELMQQLTKAASHVSKTYMVKVSGTPTPEEIEKLRAGIHLPPETSRAGTMGGTQPGMARRSGAVRTQPARINLVREQDNPWYEVTLTEGRNRQIRRMFEQIGHHVEKIKRTRYGPLELDVEPGKWRPLKQREVEALRRAHLAPVPVVQRAVPAVSKPVPSRVDTRAAGRERPYSERSSRGRDQASGRTGSGGREYSARRDEGRPAGRGEFTPRDRDERRPDTRRPATRGGEERPNPRSDMSQNRERGREGRSSFAGQRGGDTRPNRTSSADAKRGFAAGRERPYYERISRGRDKATGGTGSSDREYNARGGERRPNTRRPAARSGEERPNPRSDMSQNRERGREGRGSFPGQRGGDTRPNRTSSADAKRGFAAGRERPYRDKAAGRTGAGTREYGPPRGERRPDSREYNARAGERRPNTRRPAARSGEERPNPRSDMSQNRERGREGRGSFAGQRGSDTRPSRSRSGTAPDRRGQSGAKPFGKARGRTERGPSRQPQDKKTGGKPGRFKR